MGGKVKEGPMAGAMAAGSLPEGYLMPLSTAARELGLEVGDLLEWAEEINGQTHLRVCVQVPGGAFIQPAPEDIRSSLREPAGLQPADRRFAFVDSDLNDWEDESGPGFFRKLSAKREATLGSGDMLMMVDNSGGVWADGMTVRLEELWVPREDIERLRTNKPVELSEKRAQTLLVIIGAMAKLLAKTETTFGSEDDPSARAIAKDLAALVPGGSPAEKTIADKLNEGLAVLAKNAVGEPTKRKAGRKKGDDR